MLNYQRLHYNEYRIMLPNGDSFETTRRECFAPGEPPTENNTYQQRWFYSPDCALAIRLPQNEMGERIYRLNAAALKYEERDVSNKTACVAQYKSAECPVTCQKCLFYDSCSDLKNQANNGENCRHKCECCAVRTPRNVELDAPCGTDDDGDEIMMYIPAKADAAEKNIRAELEQEVKTAVNTVLDSLSKTDFVICECKKHKMTNSAIGIKLGITEGAVRKRIKKLEKIFDAAGLKKFL